MKKKHLYLIRHAKSSWADGSLSDHDRPLNKRGSRDAPGMAQRLSETTAPPSHFVVSTSQRTRETFASIQAAFEGKDVYSEFKEELYLAGMRQILDLIAELPDEVDSAALIGHNPGMSYTASHISGEPVNMVTSHVVGVEIHVEDWAQISADTGSIVYFDFPKKHSSS